MKKITAGKQIALGLLLAAVVSFLICRHGDGHEIQSAAFLSSRDGFLYGMDITDDYYYLFRTDESTGYSRMVRVSRLGGDGTVKISDPTVGNNGQLYFYYEKAGDKNEQWIGTCDFFLGKIRKAWDLAKITDGIFWFLDGGGETIFMEAYGENDSVHEWILDLSSMNWESNGQYDALPMSGDYLFDGNKTYWRIGFKGNIYVKVMGQEEVCAFSNDGSQIGTSNCGYFQQDGELHFLNLESGKNYALKFADGKGELHVCETCVTDAELRKRFGYVSEVKKAKEGQTVGFTWTDGKKVPFVYGENSFALLKLQASFRDQALWMMILTLMIFLLLVMAYFIIRLICMRNGGVFPLLMQMLLVGVPLFMAVCIQSSEMLDRILVDRLLETETGALVQAGVLYRDSIRPGDEILSGEPKESGEDNYLIRPVYHNIADGKEKWEADIYYAYSYACRDGEIYPLSMGYGLTVPLSYIYGQDVYEAIQEAVSRDMPITLKHQDVNGSWLSVFVPYHDGEGNTAAVIEMREDIQISLTRISKPIGMAARAVFFSFGILAAAVLLIIFFSLLPLRSLSRAVSEISRGKLDIQVKESLRFTEIGRISQVFNQMSFNISRTMRELTEIGRQYAMFIPVQFLGYLGRESILETKHGDYAEEDFVVMEISSSDFEAVSGMITGQQTFEVINQALERMIPVLEEHGGMVTNFTNAGALSIYKDDGNQALSAAVSVLQSMNRECLKAGETPLTYTAGICFGPVRLGIIGAGNRLEAAAMSLNCQFAGMLQRMAVKYGAGILITGEAVKHVRNFESDYHSRTLGYVLFTSKNVVDVIYDVYDGDDADKRQLKKQTKELFETGVKLYMGAQFLEARNCFVRVLFENRNDLAARQYFAFCEEHLNGEKDGKDCHYIEVF